MVRHERTNARTCTHARIQFRQFILHVLINPSPCNQNCVESDYEEDCTQQINPPFHDEVMDLSAKIHPYVELLVDILQYFPYVDAINNFASLIQGSNVL